MRNAVFADTPSMGKSFRGGGPDTNGAKIVAARLAFRIAARTRA
jgi:hypothetical protein